MNWKYIPKAGAEKLVVGSSGNRERVMLIFRSNYLEKFRNSSVGLIHVYVEMKVGENGELFDCDLKYGICALQFFAPPSAVTFKRRIFISD